MSSKPFTDKRGKITDLIVTPQYSITHITFNNGAIRGNHYHKKTTQHDLILKGKLMFAGEGYTEIVEKGDWRTHTPGSKHAYKSYGKSEMISICFGVRKGKNYEKDTYRLEGKDKLI